jgi:hypothetical protein
MPVKTEIIDGKGRGRSAEVTPAGTLLVVPQTETARGIDPRTIANQLVLSERFTDSAGSFEQVVDGSVTPVEFSIRAEQGFTKWLRGFRMVVIGPNLDINSNQLRRYGAAGTGLTNGIEIESFQEGETANIAAAPIQTIADYFIYQDDFTSLTGAITNNDDLLTIDFLFARPVVLVEGTTDEVTIRIRDDLTAALNTADSSQFAIARGWKEIL